RQLYWLGPLGGLRGRAPVCQSFGGVSAPRPPLAPPPPGHPEHQEIPAASCPHPSSGGSIVSAQTGTLKEDRNRASKPLPRCTPNVGDGSKPECLPNARMSALASCGQTAPCALLCHVPMIGIGGSLAAPPLPHHLAYGSVPR